MKVLNCIFAISFIYLTLSSCDQGDAPSDIEIQKSNEQIPALNKYLVDYKIDKYKICIGENYKVSDKIIDWRWDGMADEDGNIDSIGKDAFRNLDEPLINYENGSWLPALHISTDKNIIVSFSCSILFHLSSSKSGESDFLDVLSKDIKQLRNKEVIKSLIGIGSYEISNSDFVEIFKLTKSEEGYDKFEYSVQKIRGNSR